MPSSLKRFTVILLGILVVALGICIHYNDLTAGCIILYVAPLLQFSFTRLYTSCYRPPHMILYRMLPYKGAPMYYLIAGNLNQADNAFCNLLDLVPTEAGITFVNYRGTGYCARSTAMAICKDSAIRESPINVIAISQGAQPTLMLTELPNIGKIFLLNPCVSFNFLQPSKKPLVNHLGVYIFGIISWLIPYVSFIPILSLFKPDWHGYSLVLLNDQFVAIRGFVPEKPSSLDNIGVITSDQDEILDNQVIKDYFAGCAEIVSIPTPHGDTRHYAEEYRKGLRQLMDTMG